MFETMIFGAEVNGARKIKRKTRDRERERHEHVLKLHEIVLLKYGSPPKVAKMIWL